MKNSLLIGAAYFAVIFVLGFVLGTVRVVVVAPAVCAIGAVLLELPLMVAASWIVAERLLRSRPYDRSDRRLIGSTAFVLLMASEASLAVALFGRSFAEWAEEIATPQGMLGLAGQLIFAAIPLMVCRPKSSTAGDRTLAPEGRL